MKETIRRDAMFLDQLEQFVVGSAAVALLVGVFALMMLLA